MDAEQVEEGEEEDVDEENLEEEEDQSIWNSAVRRFAKKRGTNSTASVEYGFA